MVASYNSLVGLAVGGKYEVRRVLGVGGMGVVCEAVHIDLGKKVALKLIDKSMKESELIVARFKREARALGQIQSEHIVDVFDVGADPRVGLYMVMEHLTGEDLQTRLEREKRLDVKTAVVIAHEIAHGLAKAHAAGVVHRDLKPANIFLTKRDNGHLLVKLLDFGVSKVLADEGGARITGSGAPIGTPLYMSPEQAEGRDDTDARADIWSLGAVMYEALAGTPPFADRGSYHGTIVGILTSRPKLLHDAAPWVPADLAGVVDAMLVHDRSARIKDAATVTRRLIEAFPAVLPDGTGRHTAVILHQASATVDAMGETEVFTAGAIPSSMNPTGQARDAPEGNAPRQTSSAARTAAPTPVDQGKPRSAPGAGDPGVWGSASSSAGGVSMPETPALMEPLPLSVAPDTMRDESLAVHAERRRRILAAVAAIAIVCVAVGGYFAGRRASAVPPSPVSPPTPSASTLPSATASASGSASSHRLPSPPASVGAATEAASVTGPGATPSVGLPGTAPSASSGARPPRRRTKAAPSGAPAEDSRDPADRPPSEAPPDNPYITP